MKKNVHFVHNALLSANNPVSLNVIGGGATGSNLMEAIGRLHIIAIATGRAGFKTTLFDPDHIEDPNFGRSAYNENYLGVNKAVAVINHINRKYGTNWKAVPSDYVPKNTNIIPRNRMANITFSCVDTVKARFGIAQVLSDIKKSKDIEAHRDRPLYLMDFGNSKKTGQVVLSTIGRIYQPESDFYNTVNVLPSLTEEFGNLLSESEDIDNTPSCSIFEALSKQSLFINSSLAQHAGALLDEMFNDGVIDIRGFFVNLETHRVEPIKL